MPGKTNAKRDAFGFSLRGLSATASYTAAAAVADDGINAAWDERLKREQVNTGEASDKSRARFGRFWLFRNLRARSEKKQSAKPD